MRRRITSLLGIPATPLTILGSALLADFHAGSGVLVTNNGGVYSWTDRARGIVAFTEGYQSTAGFQGGYYGHFYQTWNGKRALICTQNYKNALAFTQPTSWPVGSAAFTLGCAARNDRSGYSSTNQNYVFSQSGGTSAGQSRLLLANPNTVYPAGYGNDFDTGVNWKLADLGVIWENPAGSNPMTKVSVNGAQPLLKQLTTFNVSVTYTTLTGGSRANSSQWCGPLGQIFYAARTLTDSERADLHGAMAWDWGFQASLPVGSKWSQGRPYAELAPDLMQTETGLVLPRRLRRKLWTPGFRLAA